MQQYDQRPMTIFIVQDDNTRYKLCIKHEGDKLQILGL